MEFDKNKWSYPWTSEQNCTQNFARSYWGEGDRDQEVRVLGVVGSSGGGVG